MIQPRSQAIIDDHVFLAGRPPIGEFLGFIRTRSVDGQSTDQGQLMEEWRTANDRVIHLDTSESGLADNPAIQSIPEGLQPIIQEVLENPIYRRAFQIFPTDIGIVELDRLVVYQKHINLSYVNEIKTILGTNPSPDAIARLALSIERHDPPVRMMQTASNIFTYISLSDDFRFLEPVLLNPDQIKGYMASGPIIKVLALIVGYGSNYLNALSIENRLVLNNGSHRAYALRDLGVTHTPCIIQQVSRRDELELIGVPDLQQNPDRYLRAPRPPLLKDYFDPLLRKIVQVPRNSRQVKISFNVEVTDTPAA